MDPGLRRDDSDGFVESFPVPALMALLQAKLGRAQLTKADWIGLGAIVRSLSPS
jgi:hypothetical protein